MEARRYPNPSSSIADLAKSTSGTGLRLRVCAITRAEPGIAKEINLRADQVSGDVQLHLGRVSSSAEGLGQRSESRHQAGTALSRERQEPAEGRVEHGGGAGLQRSRQSLSDDPDEVPAAGV